ncbi:MAG: CPXCG motif-containing cysteine-rich protein [Gammaproteobacteria bacterium]|nr:CPXCG motif-containing cysteine-rich protein [Gammaproteobacteria bacterium]
MIETVLLSCPYCGEAYETVVDGSAGDQAYIEDCAVCCRPIECRLTVTADGVYLEAKRDDD